MSPRHARKSGRPNEDIAPEALLAEAWRLSAGPALWDEDESYVGKAYARMSTDEGEVCLRRLPVGVSPAWLEAEQHAVDYLAAHGFGLFPRFIPTEAGDLAVIHGGRWYELTAWAPGESAAAPSLSDEQLANLARAIARLHLAGASAPGPPVRFDWLTPRQAAIQHLAWDPISRGKNAWQNPNALAAFFHSLLRDHERAASSNTAREIVELARKTLARLGPAALPTLSGASPTLAHGDLWTDHVRFQGNAVTALLDLDTLALRPPGGDVAALCADFALWGARRSQLILDAYRGEHPLSTEEADEIPVLGALRALGILRARLSIWLEARDRSAREEELDRSTAFWREQLPRTPRPHSRRYLP